jgi:hypothetical protein
MPKTALASMELVMVRGARYGATNERCRCGILSWITFGLECGYFWGIGEDGRSLYALTTLQIPLPRRIDMTNRYSTAYRVASFNIIFGKIIIVLSILLGALFILITMVGLHDVSVALFGWALIWSLVGVGAGLVVMAQGQIMRAVLDTAVNTSPLMDLDQKAEILGVKSVERSSYTITGAVRPT